MAEEFVPYQANRFHYHWHWWYNFGVGGLGGDGPHEIDYARWGLGVETHPTTVAGLGSKYYFDDDQEYPDTGTVVFEWPGDDKVGHKRQFIFELRIWSTNYPFNVDSGAEFYGTKGKMFLSKRGKLEILDGATTPSRLSPKTLRNCSATRPTSWTPSRPGGSPTPRSKSATSRPAWCIWATWPCASGDR